MPEAKPKAERPKPKHTKDYKVAVPPSAGRKGPERHVQSHTPFVALCGFEIPFDWYVGDAGEFGKKSDCADCFTKL